MTPTEFKQARQSLGLTQTEAAKWLGVTFRNVQQWEGAERAVNSSAAILMQAYLGGWRRVTATA